MHPVPLTNLIVEHPLDVDAPFRHGDPDGVVLAARVLFEEIVDDADVGRKEQAARLAGHL